MVRLRGCIALLLLVVSVHSFHITSHRVISLKIKGCGSRSQGIFSLRLSANVSRRGAVGTLLAVGAEAFGLRKSLAAALSGADPEDKNKLLQAIQVISDFEAQYKDPSQWSQLIEKLSQAPYTKDTFDKLFTLAAKSLPPNIQKIYGGDGGQWVGLKTEAVDAMDAFVAELRYLESQRAKGGAGAALDTADLQGYYELLRSKAADFVALYSNKTLNATLKGVGFCAYSSSAKCDDFDDDKDVKASAKQGGIYNEFRYGSKERAAGGGVSEDSVSIKAYRQESLLK